MAEDEARFVTHQEFSQFRTDVSANFDRMFLKIDRMSDSMAQNQKTSWSPIATMVGIVVSAAIVLTAGYIGHIQDGHPYRVEEKLDKDVHYIQLQINEMKSNRFTAQEGAELKRYIDRIDEQGTAYVQQLFKPGR